LAESQDEGQTVSRGPGKGPRLSRNDQKWETLREDIRRIYMTANNTLPNTMLMIEETHSFKASYVLPPCLCRPDETLL
jgi:hypothetical protein